MHRPAQNPDARPCPSPRAQPLQWGQRRWCAVAIGLTAIAVTVPGALAAPHGDTDEAVFADQVLAAVNQYRAQQALAAWPTDDGLVAIALDHSRLMARRTRLGHDGFDGRLQRTRSRRCVETLAAGFSDAQALVSAWRRSPSHHDKLLEPQVRRAGIASVDGYVTLLACD